MSVDTELISLSSSVSQHLDEDTFQGAHWEVLFQMHIHVAEPFTSRSPFTCAACTGLAELGR